MAGMRKALLILTLAIIKTTLQCYHTFKVIDMDTGRGIPMVNLTTVDLVPHYTDSNGVVAYYEPEMKKLPESVVTYFTPIADGYTYQDVDWLGISGIGVHASCDGRTIIKMKRTNIAQRLYRITGRGIYRDSVMVNESVPGMTNEFVENNMILKQQVVGQDSVMTVQYNNKTFWFYGDTNKLSYPLGNFFVTGATTPIDGWDVEVVIDLQYITEPNDTFVKRVAPETDPKGGPTWIWAPYSQDGNTNLYASYLRAYHEKRGFIKWNDVTEEFDLVQQFNESVNVWPTDGGHTLTWRNELLFSNPFPHVKTKLDSYINLDEYRTYTPLKEGTGIPVDLSKVQLDRSFDGTLNYAWKKNTSPLGAAQMNTLVGLGLMTQEEALWLQVRSADENAYLVMLHAGSVSFNKYRNRWIMIGEQTWGIESFLGEIWYAEAVSPLGPWCFAVKVVSHKRRDFYNPVHHSFLDKGPNIYFEGTYVNTYDKGAPPTPYYDYNQQLYKLELNDTRLYEIPVLIWKQKTTNKLVVFENIDDGDKVDYDQTFFAYDRLCRDCSAVYQDDAGLLYSTESAGRSFIFYAKKDIKCWTSACQKRKKELVLVDGAKMFVQIIPPYYRESASSAQMPYVWALVAVLAALILIVIVVALSIGIIAWRKRAKAAKNEVLLDPMLRIQE
jgi:hypothetical protein